MRWNIWCDFLVIFRTYKYNFLQKLINYKRSLNCFSISYFSTTFPCHNNCICSFVLLKLVAINQVIKTRKTRRIAQDLGSVWTKFAAYLLHVFRLHSIVRRGGCRWPLGGGKVDSTISVYVLVHRAIILKKAKRDLIIFFRSGSKYDDHSRAWRCPR